VVIGAVESDETDHKAADGLHPGLAIETEKPPTPMFRFWRKFGALIGWLIGRPAPATS
jgi:hypothetical protein